MPVCYCVLDEKMSEQPVHVKPSKGKQKRLNRRAKAVRVQTDLAKEKAVRKSAEKFCKHWRGKALQYQRYSYK